MKETEIIKYKKLILGKEFFEIEDLLIGEGFNKLPMETLDINKVNPKQMPILMFTKKYDSFSLIVLTQLTQNLREYIFSVEELVE